MEWILIVNLFVGPTSADNIQIKRFPSLKECVEISKDENRCIAVLRNK